MTWLRRRLTAREKAEWRALLKVCGWVWAAGLAVFVMACTVGKMWP